MIFLLFVSSIASFAELTLQFIANVTKELRTKLQIAGF